MDQTQQTNLSDKQLLFIQNQKSLFSNQILQKQNTKHVLNNQDRKESFNEIEDIIIIQNKITYKSINQQNVWGSYFGEAGYFATIDQNSYGMMTLRKGQLNKILKQKYLQEYIGTIYQNQYSIVDFNFDKSLNKFVVTKLDQGEKEKFKKEYKILEQLKGSNITLEVISTFKENTFKQISGKTNLDSLKKQMNDNHVFCYFYLVLLDKLNRMHEKGVAHSDIKPQNIVISFENEPYFIDFGSSINLSNKNDYQFYLSEYTSSYNLQKYLKKREQFQDQEEIKLCDKTQLSITFLFLFCNDEIQKQLFQSKKYNQLIQNLCEKKEFSLQKNQLILSIISRILNEADSSINIIEEEKKQEYIFYAYDLQMALEKCNDIILNNQVFIVNRINKFNILMIYFLDKINCQLQIIPDKTLITPLHDIIEYKFISEKYKINTYFENLINANYYLGYYDFFNLCEYVKVYQIKELNFLIKYDNEEYFKFIFQKISNLNSLIYLELNIQVDKKEISHFNICQKEYQPKDLHTESYQIFKDTIICKVVKYLNFNYIVCNQCEQIISTIKKDILIKVEYVPSIILSFNYPCFKIIIKIHDYIFDQIDMWTEIRSIIKTKKINGYFEFILVNCQFSKQIDNILKEIQQIYDEKRKYEIKNDYIEYDQYDDDFFKYQIYINKNVQNVQKGLKIILIDKCKTKKLQPDQNEKDSSQMINGEQSTENQCEKDCQQILNYEQYNDIGKDIIHIKQKITFNTSNNPKIFEEKQTNENKKYPNQIMKYEKQIKENEIQNEKKYNTYFSSNKIQFFFQQSQCNVSDLDKININYNHKNKQNILFYFRYKEEVNEQNINLHIQNLIQLIKNKKKFSHIQIHNAINENDQSFLFYYMHEQFLAIYYKYEDIEIIKQLQELCQTLFNNCYQIQNDNQIHKPLLQSILLGIEYNQYFKLTEFFFFKNVGEKFLDIIKFLEIDIDQYIKDTAHQKNKEFLLSFYSISLNDKNKDKESDENRKIFMNLKENFNHFQKYSIINLGIKNVFLQDKFPLIQFQFGCFNTFNKIVFEFLEKSFQQNIMYSFTQFNQEILIDIYEVIKTCQQKHKIYINISLPCLCQRDTKISYSEFKQFINKNKEDNLLRQFIFQIENKSNEKKIQLQELEDTFEINYIDKFIILQVRQIQSLQIQSKTIKMNFMIYFDSNQKDKNIVENIIDRYSDVYQ